MHLAQELSLGELCKLGPIHYYILLRYLKVDIIIRKSYNIRRRRNSQLAEFFFFFFFESLTIKTLSNILVLIVSG